MNTGLYGAMNLNVKVCSGPYGFVTKYPSTAFVVKAAIVKTHTDWAKILIRALGCNFMVCMAVWMASGATDVFSKCFTIWFAITLFITIGFEHLVVNMFLIPLGMLVGAPGAVGVNLIGRNFVPVTIGNILGALCLAIPMYVVHGPAYEEQKSLAIADGEAPGDSMRYAGGGAGPAGLPVYSSPTSSDVVRTELMSVVAATAAEQEKNKV